MKKSEAQKILDSEFKNNLLKKSFKKIKYGFIKTEGDSYFKLIYSLVDSDNSFPATFSYAIGLLSVRNILRIILPETFNNSDNVFPPIIGIGQAALYDEKKYPKLEYDLYTESDIQQMVKEVTEYLEKEALPFFESLNTIEKLEMYRNANPIPQQAKNGLILAKLAGNANYENLKGQYRLLLKDWAENDKQELEKVISFLDQHSKDELLKISESQA